MGTTSHLSPGAYSKRFNDFLAAVIEAKGGRLAERWAEAHMPKTRGRSYWHKLMTGRQAMTTEDIAVIAEWLEVDPFTFIRGVNAGDVSLVVGGTEQDEPDYMPTGEAEKLRKDAYDLASRRGSRK